MFERRMAKRTSSILKPKKTRFPRFSPIVVIIITLMAAVAAAACALVSSSKGNNQVEDKNVELILISSTGITPTEITRAAGGVRFHH
jgi:hypothetical protein